MICSCNGSRPARFAMPASHITLHGVFLEISGLGVLLSGPAGVGKGELALELITRGHRLIADDAPEFTPAAGARVIGSCPALLQGFLEVRALGILNIPALFGTQAIATQSELGFIVELAQSDEKMVHTIDNPAIGMRAIFDAQIPQAVLQTQSGRNLAVLVECLVRNYLLQSQGHHAAREFGLLQGQAIAKLSS